MDREALAALSRAKLVELVLGLAARVAELEAKSGGPPKTPEDASVPPSAGFKANRADRRARRRRGGHAAERDLRPSVIHRKVTGGFRSPWGAEASAIVTTLLAAARKRGQNAYAALRAVAGPAPRHAAGMAT